MSVIIAQGIANVIVPLLARSLVLPRTVTLIPQQDFAGDNGDTISVRVPNTLAARTQATDLATITYDDVIENRVDVTLAHLYHAKRIGAKELNFNIVDFRRQITEPQVEAVARGAEDNLAAVMNGLTNPTAPSDFLIAADGSNIETVVLAARRQLTRNRVPLTDRYMACSPEVIEQILSIETFTRVDAAGSDEELRNATIGRYRGFTIVESEGLDAGEAVAYHRSGFVMSNPIPVPMPGVVSASSQSVQGQIGVRQTFQYVPDLLGTTSVVNTFVGSSAVLDDPDDSASGGQGDTALRFVKIATAAA